MTAILSGPMFEGAKNGPWESVHRKDGGHYNNYGCSDRDGMRALREFFPKGEANEFNVCLFSTSGVHGTYTTIEAAEEEWSLQPLDEDDERPSPPQVTFLIVQPRICTVRHGNCIPESQEDFDYLKKLRQSSWGELQKIGRAG
jgi:hypothetical protein